MLHVVLATVQSSGRTLSQSDSRPPSASVVPESERIAAVGLVRRYLVTVSYTMAKTLSQSKYVSTYIGDEGPNSLFVVTL